MVKKFSILQVPNKILTTKAKPVKEVTPEIQQLIDNMKLTLLNQEKPRGVGLAAPQIGKSLQIFVTRVGEGEPFRVFINPKITLKYTRKRILEDKPDPDMLEGCLSISNMWGVTDRAPAVGIDYMDIDGKIYHENVKGFLARIIQHECDHLNGILFPTRVLDAGRRLYREEVDEKGEEFFTIIDHFTI